MLRQIAAVKDLHHNDLEEGFGEVYIPEAIFQRHPAFGGGEEIGEGVTSVHIILNGIRVIDKI